MRRVRYSDLLSKLAARYELADSSYFSEEQQRAINEHFDAALRGCWDAFVWPELVATEQRFYRDTWSAGTYASGSEVYHAGTDAYYRATASTSQEPSATASNWSLLSVGWFRYVAWEQTGKAALGDVISLHAADPRAYDYTRMTLPEIFPEGIRVPDSFGTSIWVRYRLARPSLIHVIYDAATAYAVGAQILFTDGDLYRCLTATDAGEAPATTPAKWSLIEVPLLFREALVEMVYARLKEGEDAAAAARAEARAQAYLQAEFEDILLNQSNGRRVGYRVRPRAVRNWS